MVRDSDRRSSVEILERFAAFRGVSYRRLVVAHFRVHDDRGNVGSRTDVRRAQRRRYGAHALGRSRVVAPVVGFVSEDRRHRSQRRIV